MTRVHKYLLSRPYKVWEHIWENIWGWRRCLSEVLGFSSGRYCRTTAGSSRPSQLNVHVQCEWIFISVLATTQNVRCAHQGTLLVIKSLVCKKVNSAPAILFAIYFHCNIGTYLFTKTCHIRLFAEMKWTHLIRNDRQFNRASACWDHQRYPFE